MPQPELHPQPQKPPQDAKVQPVKVNVQSTDTKPDKNAHVPKYDLLTEGYDPAKLKRR